jgi:hypothetical protein
MVAQPLLRAVFTAVLLTQLATASIPTADRKEPKTVRC